MVRCRRAGNVTLLICLCKEFLSSLHNILFCPNNYSQFLLTEEFSSTLVLVFNWNHFEMRLLNLRINFYLLRTFFPHLGSFFVLLLLSLRFGQISPLAFHSCCLSHHVFDQVNLWPAWVGFETAIF